MKKKTKTIVLFLMLFTPLAVFAKSILSITATTPFPAKVVPQIRPIYPVKMQRNRF